jgi:hypothetical protein
MDQISQVAENAEDERWRKQPGKQRPDNTENGTGSGGCSVAANDRATLDADSPALAGIAMQSPKYDHCLTLKITSAMKEEIDAVLARLKGSIVQTRSEFLRMAAAYSLASSREKPPTRLGVAEKE